MGIGLIVTGGVKAPTTMRGLAKNWGCRSIAATIVVYMLPVAASPHEAAAETMEAALARAYQSNPQLNAQRAIVRQSDEGVAQALSGYRPSIAATASVGRQWTDEKEIFPPIPGTALTQGVAVEIKGTSRPRSVGATGTQTLFNGEQTANSVRKAESQVSADRETLRVMEQSVLLAAATVYMDVSRDTANLEVQQSNLRVLQRMLKDTRQRFSAGAITETDVDQAEAQLAGGEANLHAAEATLMTTRANYRRIIGNDPANLAPASPVDRFAPSTLPASIALGTAQNPSVIAATYGVDVALLQVKIAEGALWPTLVAQGSVQQQYDANITTPKLFTELAMLNSACRFIKAARNMRRSVRTKRRSANNASMSIKCATKLKPMWSRRGDSCRRRKLKSKQRNGRAPPRRRHSLGSATRPLPANGQPSTCLMPSKLWSMRASA